MFRYFENNPSVFNLGFGDVDASGKINDTAISNNFDSEKVQATVASTICKFYERYSDCWIFVTGTTKSRTRLYGMVITNKGLHLSKRKWKKAPGCWLSRPSQRISKGFVVKPGLNNSYNLIRLNSMNPVNQVVHRHTPQAHAIPVD